MDNDVGAIKIAGMELEEGIAQTSKDLAEMAGAIFKTLREEKLFGEKHTKQAMAVFGMEPDGGEPIPVKFDLVFKADEDGTCSFHQHCVNNHLSICTDSLTGMVACVRANTRVMLEEVVDKWRRLGKVWEPGKSVD